MLYSQNQATQVNLKEHSLSQEINMKTHSGQTPF